MRIYKTGWHHTEETKKKMREKRLGWSPSEETRKRMGAWQVGRKLSAEVVEKVRRASIGRKHPPRSKGWREKQRAARLGKYRGEKATNWRGGITSINMLIRSSDEYKLWRKAVFERDNYTCIWCGIRSGSGKKVVLHADHIKPFALYPELRFAIDNGRTLCKDCHKKTDTYCGRTKKYDTKRVCNK